MAYSKVIVPTAGARVPLQIAELEQEVQTVESRERE
jgi:hypothetical protein